MNRATQTIVGAGFGYLVGRRRKLRLVLVLGGAAAAGRISANRRGLLSRGVKALGGSADLSRMADLGAPLVAAARTAATSAVTRRIDSVSTGLRQRADLLRGPGAAEADEAAEPPRGRPRDARATTRRGRRAESGEGEEFDAEATLETERGDSSEQRTRDRRGATTRRRPEPRDAGDDDLDEDDLDPDDLDEEDPADPLAEDDEREPSTEAPRRSTRRRTTDDAPAVRRRAR